MGGIGSCSGSSGSFILAYGKGYGAIGMVIEDCGNFFSACGMF